MLKRRMRLSRKGPYVRSHSKERRGAFERYAGRGCARWSDTGMRWCTETISWLEPADRQ